MLRYVRHDHERLNIPMVIIRVAFITFGQKDVIACKVQWTLPAINGGPHTCQQSVSLLQLHAMFMTAFGKWLMVEIFMVVVEMHIAEGKRRCIILPMKTSDM